MPAPSPYETGHETASRAWLMVPGYEGRYAVARDGRVFSLTRGPRRAGPDCPRELRVQTNTRGRRYVGLVTDGLVRTWCVSDLLALAQGIPRPSPLHVVHHRDGDYGNFAPENLVWLLPGERMVAEGRKRRTAFRGVNYVGPVGRFPWQAKVVWQRAVVFCDCYQTELEAAVAYNQAVRTLGLPYPLNPVPEEVEVRTMHGFREMPVLPDEIWKPLPGFERDYEVSSLGRIRSLPRRDAQGVRVGGLLRKLHRSPHGRWLVVIADVRIDVAVAMLWAFHQGKPRSAYEAELVDGDPGRCELGNLRFVAKPHTKPTMYGLRLLAGGEPRS